MNSTDLPLFIIIMKVGPHSNMSLKDIILSKLEEEKKFGKHFWGYSGVFCQPKKTQLFCKWCKESFGIAPKLVLIETKSSYNSSTIGKIDSSSIDSQKYEKFNQPVQLQGAEFSFVVKNLRIIENFPIEAYNVVGGKNNGLSVIQHLKYRVNKTFATLDINRCVELKRLETSKVLIADLIEPYSIWLK